MHLFSIFLCVLYIFHFVESQGFRDSYIAFNGHGHRLIILVAFSDDYILSTFVETLSNFVNAFGASHYRQQFITIYFGNLHMKIDCDYSSDLNKCVQHQVLNNYQMLTLAHNVRHRTVRRLQYLFPIF